MIPLWAIVKTWLVPMPIHENSSVLPVFFLTLCQASVPCIHSLGERPESFSAVNFTLIGSLCLYLNKNIPFIRMQRADLASWHNPLGGMSPSISSNILGALAQVAAGSNSGSGMPSTANSTSITTMMITYNGLIPKTPSNLQTGNATQRRGLPFCFPTRSFPQVFTPCQ